MNQLKSKTSVFLFHFLTIMSFLYIIKFDT